MVWRIGSRLGSKGMIMEEKEAMMLCSRLRCVDPSSDLTSPRQSYLSPHLRVLTSSASSLLNLVSILPHPRQPFRHYPQAFVPPFPPTIAPPSAPVEVLYEHQPPPTSDRATMAPTSPRRVRVTEDLRGAGQTQRLEGDRPFKIGQFFICRCSRPPKNAGRSWRVSIGPRRSWDQGQSGQIPSIPCSLWCSNPRRRILSGSGRICRSYSE